MDDVSGHAHLQEVSIQSVGHHPACLKMESSSSAKFNSTPATAIDQLRLNPPATALVAMVNGMEMR